MKCLFYPSWNALIICEESSQCKHSLDVITKYFYIMRYILDNLHSIHYNDTVSTSLHLFKEENIQMKKEIKSSLGLNHMNGLTADDERTCGLQDMNCLETKDKAGLDITDMNAVGKDDETTCALQDMNCTGSE